MSDTTAQQAEPKSLFAEHEKIHPLKVSGLFRKIKWFFLINMLAGILYRSLPSLGPRPRCAQPDDPV